MTTTRGVDALETRLHTEEGVRVQRLQTSGCCGKAPRNPIQTLRLVDGTLLRIGLKDHYSEVKLSQVVDAYHSTEFEQECGIVLLAAEPGFRNRVLNVVCWRFAILPSKGITLSEDDVILFFKKKSAFHSDAIPITPSGLDDFSIGAVSILGTFSSVGEKAPFAAPAFALLLLTIQTTETVQTNKSELLDLLQRWGHLANHLEEKRIGREVAFEAERYFSKSPFQRMLGAKDLTTTLERLRRRITSAVVDETFKKVATQGTNDPPVMSILPASVLPTKPKQPGEIDVQAVTFGGEEGPGPGLFNDTRSIAVDGDGRIYTGDYDGGRIQVFDSRGNFLNLWYTNDKGLIHNMAASRDGKLYVVERRSICKYDGCTGEFLCQFPKSKAFGGLRRITVAPDGSVIAAGREELVVYDPNGVITSGFPKTLNQFEFSGSTEAIDVDGYLDIYILNGNHIYRYDRKGNFIDRIGSRGHAPDQFRTSPNSLGIDGRSRIYACDFDGIKVFSRDGRYLGIINFRGAAFQMVFDDKSQLHVVDRNNNRVIKYKLNKEDAFEAL